jgi:plastocyanin
MERRWIRRGVAALAMLIVMGPMTGGDIAAASGGGGCGRAVTDRHGTTVSIRNYCFGPTILRVRPGQTVTWINRDPFPHSVLGVNGIWGAFDDLRRGNTVSYRFGRAGVYPYVCTFHVGMEGAVVVGSASGPGLAGATVTSAGPVTRVFQPAAVADAASPVGALPTVDAPSRSGWAAGAAAGVLIAVLVAVAAASIRRHRRVMSS